MSDVDTKAKRREQAVAGGAEARDRRSVDGAGSFGFGRGAPVRRQRQPGIQLASPLSRGGAATGTRAIDAGLVPVTITPRAGWRESASPPAPAVSETIEIEVGGDYRVRVGADFDGRALKRVLDVLRKR